MAAPLSAPLFWKLDFSKIWTLILLWFKTDCWYSNFSFLYVQISSNIRKMWNFGIIWFIRPSKILPRLQKIAIFCNLNQHSVESDLNEIWHSFYIPIIPQASYFHNLFIVKKGGGKGCACDACKAVMDLKMWENHKNSDVFRLSIWVRPPSLPR